MSLCKSSKQVEDYDLSLHIAALFIVLTVSAVACALPLVAIKIPQLRLPTRALFAFRHFGTGVLLATAFVHLLPTAFTSLTHPCLPMFFQETYPALAGAIALASVFMITIAEMIFSPGRSLCSHRNSSRNVENLEQQGNPIPSCDCPDRGTRAPGEDEGSVQTAQHQTQSDQCSSEIAPGALQLTQNHLRDSFDHANDACSRCASPDTSVWKTQSAKDELRRRKLLMQCVLLECGILFHSIFIGMALAVAVGSEQVVLLLAIAFHQCFEGLALGSRIAVIDWPERAIQPWLMVLTYGCTTPFGQAIGIGTRNLYDPESQTGLIVVGTLNAISAGLLTYTSLVDLLSEDFLSDDSWRTLRGARRVFAITYVMLGAFCMSLIGAWA